MLTITTPDREFFNEKTGEFLTVKGTTLTMEHSLLSIRKWESKWHRPFLSAEEPTVEQMLDYFRCMTITPKNVDAKVFNGLSYENIQKIKEYINDPMTATTFRSRPNSARRGGNHGPKIITAEVVYGWMVEYGIPFECERWHYNQLMTLVRVCAQQNSMSPKMTKKEILSENRALNEARKAKLGTKG